MIREGSGFVVLVGPGFADDVDESSLTTNALWEAASPEIKRVLVPFEPIRSDVR